MTTTLERRYERRATAANWAASNPVLAAGEWGYDTTRGLIKIGDGTTAWALLPALWMPRTRVNLGAFGAVEGGANCTSALLAAQAWLTARGGGTIEIDQGDWAADWNMVDHVSIDGAGYGVTNIYPNSGTPDGVVTTDGAPLVGTNLTNLSIVGDGHAGQWGLYAEGDGSGGSGDGGWWYSQIDVHFGDDLEAGGAWFRGGGDDGLNPHQFLRVSMMARDETGRADWIGLRCTGQVGQVHFDVLEVTGPGSGTTPTHLAVLERHRNAGDSAYEDDMAPYSLTFTVPSLQGAVQAMLIDRARIIQIDNPHLENMDRGIELANSATKVNIDSAEFASVGQDSGNGWLVKVGGNCSGTLTKSSWQGTGTPDCIVDRDGSNGSIIERDNDWPTGHTSSGRLYQLNAAGSGGDLDFSNHRYVGVVGDGATTIENLTNTIGEGETLTVLALSADVDFNQAGNLIIPQGTGTLNQENGSISVWVRQGNKLWLEHGGETRSSMTRGAALRPVQVVQSAANLAFGIVANTWHDTDPGGSASARPLDMVVPNVATGDWVEVTIDYYSPSAATAVYLDIWTVVAGAVVNQFGSSTTGSVGLLIPASQAYANNGTLRYQIQSGDIENGSVRLRLRDRNTTTTARSIGSSSGILLTMGARGPF